MDSSEPQPGRRTSPTANAQIRHSAINAFEGKTLTQERDIQMARLGPLTKDQRTTHRGHVMRRLSSAIEADLRRRGKVY